MQRDINLILNYCKTYDEYLKQNSPVFVQICLPGLGDDFKVSAFIHKDKEHPLALVFIVEEQTVELQDLFTNRSTVIFEHLHANRLSIALAKSENYMFVMSNMREIECILFYHLDLK